jgi:hypothetical protein
MLGEVVVDGRSVRVGIRALPWLLAIAALVIALVGSGFVIWPLVLIWFGVLALVFAQRHA